MGKLKNFEGNFKIIGGKCISGIWKCFFFNFGQLGANGGKCVNGIWKCFFNWGHFLKKLGANGRKFVSEIWKCFLFGSIFFKLGAFFVKLEAKNNFGIEKISCFGNYMDLCVYLVIISRNSTCGWGVYSGGSSSTSLDSL